MHTHHPTTSNRPRRPRPDTLYDMSFIEVIAKGLVLLVVAVVALLIMGVAFVAPIKNKGRI